MDPEDWLRSRAVISSMTDSMLFSDKALSVRLEQAEGVAGVRFAEAHRRFTPSLGSEWRRFGAAYAIFDGVDSPVTQTFGLGLDGESLSLLGDMECFFQDRGAPVQHEVSPFAGTETIGLLCQRGYQPTEISSVLVRRLQQAEVQTPANLFVRPAAATDEEEWIATHVKAWGSDYPELGEFLRQSARLVFHTDAAQCFLAGVGGENGAAAVLHLHGGVALLGGSATIAEKRRRGLHQALLAERLNYAFLHGAELAMMVTELGSNSQRNAERHGFRIAYTRVKWRLPSPST